jgi:hypothetical protein
MLKKLATLSLLSLALIPAFAQTPAPNDGLEADRRAIRAHIESIFQAFIDADVDKIFATHSEDWPRWRDQYQTQSQS